MKSLAVAIVIAALIVGGVALYISTHQVKECNSTSPFAKC
jgi:hypothetical protein